MRTVINIDDTAVAEVMDLLGLRTKTDAVNAALRNMVRRHRLELAFAAAEGIPVIDNPEEHYRKHGMDIG